jgi:hypothetical protein
MWSPASDDRPSDPRDPEDDTVPGAVLAACVLLWLQGVLAAVVFLYAAVQLIGIWSIASGDRHLLEGLGGLGVMAIAAFLFLLGVVALAVAVPSCILAARIPSHRNSVRVGALALEAVLGVTVLLFVAALFVVFYGNADFGPTLVVVVVSPWIIFGLLMSRPARTYFRV